MLDSSRIHLPLCGGGRLVEASYIARPNRFLVEAALADGGKVVQAHLADRGRLKELLLPGARMLLAEKNGAARKTAYQVAGVYSGDVLVSLDTQLPNRLIEQALLRGALPQFSGYEHVRREVQHPEGTHRSRFDLELSGPKGRCIVEVKSANLVIDGVARFPDAPTERGRRHLLELLELQRSGTRTAVVFCVQRGDAMAVAANRETDPAFAATLDEVAAAGLELYGYLCPLTPAGITLADPLPVMMNC